MAKRRLWDSKGSPNCTFEALSLGFLLLLTSLITIQCASFGSHLRGRPNSDETNLDSLIGQWAPSPVSHISYKAFPSSSSSSAASSLEPTVGLYDPQDKHHQSLYRGVISNQPPQTATDGYGGDSPSSLADDRQKFYHQLELLAAGNSFYDSQRSNNANNLVDRPAAPAYRQNQNQNQYQLVGDSSSSSNDYELARQLASLSDSEYYNSPSLVSTNVGVGLDSDRLSELLGGRNSNDNNDDEAGEQLNRRLLSEDYQFLLEPNPKQHISIYQTQDGEAAAAATNNDDDANDSGTRAASSSVLVDSANSQQRDEDRGKNFAYQVESQQQQPSSGKGSEKRSGSQDVGPSSSSAETNKTLTTLLDEEEEENDRKVLTGGAKKTRVADVTPVVAASPAEPLEGQAAIPNGAKVATKGDTHGSVDTDRKTDGQQAGGLSRIGSLLSGLYKFVANKWPAALSVGPSSNANQAAIVKKTPPTSEDQSKAPSEQSNRIDTDQTKGTATKPSVSEPTIERADKMDEIDNGNQSSVVVSGKAQVGKWSVEENNDKRTTTSEGQIGAQIKEQQTTTTISKDAYSESSEQAIRVKEPAVGQQQQQQVDDEASSMSSFESTKRQSGSHKISLLRQSANLMMPFKSSDELLVESSSTNSQPVGSLLGKYIYAPEHHYHLGNIADSKRLLATVSDDINDGEDDDGANDNSGGQMFARMSQRSGPRNIRAGDDVYAASSFSGSSLRPLYAATRLTDGGQLGLLPNKSDDIYFLVMVGAFCAMAMTVVLAAGLFAYRVQQSRKSSSEADYPTYGVVGPNNMNGNMGGKAGSASMVGGYFAGMGGPGSSSSGGSKSGSVKQLAEMYSIGADSGISGTGAKSSANGNSKRLANDQGGQLAAASGPNNGSHGNGQANRFANQNAARMFHYQHQKQQMIISDRSSTGRQASASDLDSEEENDENSYTVYECPGLASAHEMEIKNPLFNDDQTP